MHDKMLMTIKTLEKLWGSKHKEGRFLT